MPRRLIATGILILTSIVFEGESLDSKISTTTIYYVYNKQSLCVDVSKWALFHVFSNNVRSNILLKLHRNFSHLINTHIYIYAGYDIYKPHEHHFKEIFFLFQTRQLYTLKLINRTRLQAAKIN